jgi:ribosomal protein S27E
VGLFGQSRPSAGNELSRFLAGGKEIRCAHCGGSSFRAGRAQLNTAVLSFFNLDWVDRSATTLTCAGCGFISWFATEPTRLE